MNNFLEKKNENDLRIRFFLFCRFFFIYHKIIQPSLTRTFFTSFFPFFFFFFFFFLSQHDLQDFSFSFSFYNLISSFHFRPFLYFYSNPYANVRAGHFGNNLIRNHIYLGESLLRRDSSRPITRSFGSKPLGKVWTRLFPSSYAVTQTPLKDHQLKLVWKTLRKFNDYNDN